MVEEKTSEIMLSLPQQLPASAHADFLRSCFINCDDDHHRYYCNYGACFMAGISMPEIPVPSSGRNKLPLTKKVVN